MTYFDYPYTEPEPAKEKLVVGDKWLVKTGGICFSKVTIEKIPWFILMDVRVIDEDGTRLKVSRGNFVRKAV